MKFRNKSALRLSPRSVAHRAATPEKHIRRLCQFERLEDRCLLTVSLPELVSINGLGNATASGASEYTSQSLSGDGRYQVFTSSASDIVPLDLNGSADVFLRDLQTGATTLISRATGGGTANNSSLGAVISADGAYVAFYSHATDLDVFGLNSSSGYSQIYRWQRSTGQIRLVSPNAASTDGGNNYSYEPSINENGTRIAFRTYADDLLAGVLDVNGATDVYMRDLTGTPATILVSRSSVSPLQPANGNSDAQRMSRDGSRIVYRTSATDIELGVTDINGANSDLVVFDISTQTNRYISVESTAPSSGNAGSTRTKQSLSDDGRYEVFASDASDLIDGDTNGATDVFLRDLLTGATTLISRTIGGNSANSSSHHAVISGDGNYVAFYSHATNLDVTGTNSTSGYAQIYRWQRGSGQIELISVNSSDTNGGDHYSYNPTISGDGQKIAYQSLAQDLIAGLADPNGWTDIFLRDLTGVPTSTLVSRSSASPLQTADSDSDSQRISRDGSRVVYRTSATDIELGVTDINGTNSDLVAFEISTQINQYISVESTAPSSGNAGSTRTEQSLSDDGRYEVFASDANDLVEGDANGTTDVFLRDLQTGTTTLISQTISGGSANSSSHHAVISGDGNYVAFYSHATNLDVTGTNSTSGYAQIYRWHRGSGQIELISVNSSDTNGGDYYSYYPTISGDGLRVAYQSLAQDLITGLVDASGWTIYDIFLRDLTGVPTTILVSHSSANPLQTADSGSDSQRISHDGSRIIYRTSATDIELGVTDINGTNLDLVAFEISTQINEYISVESTAPSSGNAGSTRTEQSLSDDGRYEVFASDANDLVEGDANGTTDVFLRDLQTGTTTLISQTISGGSANSSSHHAVISGDGNYVAFYSHATNLNVTGTNSSSGYAQIYRWHRGSGQIELISVNSSDTNGGDYYSYYPTISGDGQRVAYQSLAQDLIAGLVDPNGWGNYDVFIRDLTGVPTTTLVSRSSASPLQTGDYGSAFQRISYDGSTVVFLSSASDLVAGVSDGNGTNYDLFAFDISSGTLKAVNLVPAGTSTGNNPVDLVFSLSDNGQVIAFASYATDVHPLKTDAYWDVFINDLSVPFSGVELVSLNNLGVEADWTAHRPRLDASGDFVAFESSASNLSLLPTSWINNVFVRDRVASTTQLVSINNAGTAGGDNNVTEVNISRDASMVAFASIASDLDSTLSDTNGTQDVFVRDWQAISPTTRLVSRNVAGTDSANAASFQPALSENGTVITFSSNATDLVSASVDANGGAQDLFAYQGFFVELITAKGSGRFTDRNGVDAVFDISDTGRYVAFSSYAPGMSDGVIGNGYWQTYVRDLSSSSNELISEAILGGVGGYHSSGPSISGDGRYVAFHSQAQLDALDTNGWGNLDVYVRDRSLFSMHLISLNSAGTNSGDNNSQYPRISRDGSIVAFESASSDLDGSVTDSNSLQDVFVRNWRAAVPATRLVSRNAVGTDSANAVSLQPALSENGAVMTFSSNATDLVSSSFDANGGAQDLFAYQGSVVELVTVKGSGRFTGRIGVDTVFDISDTGRYVAFSSYAPGMSDGVIGNGYWQIYVRDLSSYSNELISEAMLGGVGEHHSSGPSISGDGRYVAFHSHAQLDALDTIWWGNLDVYVRDRNLSSTHLISVNSVGTNSGDNNSQYPRISRDGSVVAFESYSTDLDSTLTDSNSLLDVFVRDWQAGVPTTRLVSREATGVNSANGQSWQPALNDTGTVVTFTSYATDLVSSSFDSNGTGQDIFYYDGSSIILVTPKGSGRFTGRIGVDTVFDISDTGRYVAFSSYAPGMSDGVIGNGYWQTYVRDLSGSSNELISKTLLGEVGESHSSGPSISGDGRYVAFHSHAQLDALDTSWWGNLDVYVHDRNLSSTHLISVNSAGTNSGDNSSQYPRISRDGSTIVFESYSSDLDANVTDTNQLDVFLRKWNSTNPVTDLLSRDSTGTSSSDNTSHFPTISENGATTVFYSHGTNLTAFSDGNGSSDVFAVKAASIAISPDSAVKPEGNAGLLGYTFTVQRSWFTQSAFTVDWVVSGIGPNPANSVDFGGSFPSGQLSFGIGETSKTITVNVSGDQLVELDENFRVTLSNSTNNSQIVTSTADGLIQNDDSAVINISSVSLSEGTGGGTTSFIFNVTMNNPVDVGVSMSASTTNVTAVAPGDYTAVAAVPVTFSAGSTTTQQVTVLVNRDNLVELNETFNVLLSALSAGGRSVSLSTSTGVGTIQNDDTATINISNVTLAEGTGGGTTSFIFNVTISNPVDVGVSMSASTQNVTAVAPADFAAVAAAPVSFSAGSTTTQQVSVLVNRDNLVELNETFNVLLSGLSASGRSVSMGTSTGVGAIQNDDSASINIGNVTLAEGSGGGTTAFIFDVTISNPVDVSVSMQASSQNGTALAPSDLTAVVAAPVSFSAGSTTTQQVTVLVNRDNLVELNETFDVLLSGLSAGGRSVSLSTSTGVGTIQNDDFASVVGRFAYHGGYSGVGSPVDTGKVLAQEGPAPVTLDYSNLINTSRGINGLVFDIDGLPGTVTASDFVFQMSPTGAYNVGTNPPSNWATAPAPSSVGVTLGAPSRVLVQWANNAIANRWLRITVLANANTGLQTSQVYYLGHLLGETTGPQSNMFTVAFADITPIRNNVGLTVNANNIYDIDKSGTVAFADISAMRSNVGTQLPAITIPAIGTSELFGDGESGSGSTPSAFFSLPTTNGSDVRRRVELPLLRGGLRTPALDQQESEYSSRRKNMSREAAFDQLLTGYEYFDLQLVGKGLTAQNDDQELIRIDRAIELLSKD